MKQQNMELSLKSIEYFIFIFSIIQTRSEHRRFQLIIITHDEDFLEMLGRNEWMDRYYRITKDNK
jgi:DNA repair protein RAD50